MTRAAPWLGWLLLLASMLPLAAAAPRVAVLDFVRADSPGGPDPVLEDFSRAVQAKLLASESYAWVERQEFDRIMREADPGRTNGFDPVTAVRLGRLLQADLLLKGEVAQRAAGRAELVVEVVELRRAEVLARRTMPVAMNTRQKLHPTAEEMDAGAQLALAALDEAVAGMRQLGGRRSLAPLYFRNIGASDRLDFLEERLRAALPKAAAAETGFRVLEFPRTSEAGDEASLVLAGLTATDPEAWRSVADFYVWGSFQEEPADGAVFEDVPVTVVLQIATGAGATREVRWRGPVKALDEGLDQVARGMIEAARALAAAESTSPADERKIMARNLRRRADEIGRQIVAAGYQFLDAPAGRQLFAYQVRLLEVACFFDPQNVELQQERMNVVWSSRNPLKPLETLRGQWLRFADYRALAGRFMRLKDGTLDERWPQALEWCARQTIDFMEKSQWKARKLGVSPEEIHRQLGVMVRQWSDVVLEADRVAQREPQLPAWYLKRRAEWFAGAEFLQQLHDPLLVDEALQKTWAIWEPELGRLLKDPGKKDAALRWVEVVFSVCGALGDQDRADAMLDSAWKRGVVEKAPAEVAPQERPRAAPPKRVDRAWAPPAPKAPASGLPPLPASAPGQPAPPVLEARFREIDPRTIRGFRRARDDEATEELLTKNMAMRVNTLAWRAGKLWISENGDALPASLGPANAQGSQYLWSYDPVARTSELISSKLGAHSTVRTVHPAENSVWLGLAADGVWQLGDDGAVRRYKGEDGLQMMQIQDAVGDSKELFYLGGTLLRQTVSIFSLQEKRWSGVQVPLPSPLAPWIERFAQSPMAAQQQPPCHLAVSGDWLCFNGLWTAFYNRATKEWKTTQAGAPMGLPLVVSADEKGFWFASGSRDVTSVWLVDPAKPEEKRAVLLPPGLTRGMLHDGPWLWIALDRMADTQLALVDKRTMTCVGVLPLPVHDVTCLTLGGGRLWVGAAKRPAAPGYSGDGFALLEVADIRPMGAVVGDDIQPRELSLPRAVWRGDLAAVERLLAAKADPNATAPNRGWTALMEAAATGRSDLVQRLLAAGADPNRLSSEGETALQQAVVSGNAESVRLLLGRNAKPNLRAPAKLYGFPTWNHVRFEAPADLPASLPTAPENVRATATPEGEVLLTWDDRADNETEYWITQQNSYGMRSVTAQLPANTTRWIDPFVREEAELIYTVEARNALSDRTNESRQVEVRIVRPALSDRIFRCAQEFRPDSVQIFPVRLLAQTPLALAASAGRSDLIDLLLAAGADPNQADATGYTPLMQAVRHRQYAAARQLLAHKAKPEMVAGSGDTAALLAYRWHEDEALAEALLRAVPAAQRAEEATGLMMEAARTGQIADMKKLRALGGDLGERMVGSDSPVCQAWQSDQVETVQWLLAEQAAVLGPRLRSGKLRDQDVAMIDAAVRNNRPEAFGKLLDLGLSVDQVVEREPLVVRAAKARSFAVLALLRDRGADLKQRDKDDGAAASYLTAEQRERYLGAATPPPPTPASWPLPRMVGSGSPGPTNYVWNADPAKLEVNARLIAASREGRLADVKQALADGAEIDGYGATGLTAVQEAMKAGVFGVAHWLVEEGASVNRPSEEGYSPATFAVLAGNLKELEYLLQMGADPNLYGNHGMPPLAIAAWSGRLDLMRRLLAAGANPNVTVSIRQRHENALSMALWNGQTEAVDLLLASGAKPRGQIYSFISDGDKAHAITRQANPSWLMFAASGGKVELIQKMITLGQNPKRQVILGYDALAWAAEAGKIEAVKYLLPLSEPRGRAVESARQAGHPEIVHLLEAAGYHEAAR